MSRSGVVRCLLCLGLLFGVLGGLGGQVALAAQQSSNDSFLASVQEQPADASKLELVSRYPTYEGKSGDSFEFEVGLKWLGSEARTFNLAVTKVPPKWASAVLAGSPQKTIFVIGLDAAMVYPETIYVLFAPLPGEFPNPGDYVATLEVSSGDIKKSVELKAVVTALYRFAFYNASGRLNTEVTAGQDNHLSVIVANTGTAAIENINFISSKPSGWDITFNPDKINSLAAGLQQEVAVVINSSSKTIAGDYMVNMKAISGNTLVAPVEFDLRVTALTPTIWGWVGIIIVLIVIAGLGVTFRRLGRR